jgi:hypothetical protein
MCVQGELTCLAEIIGQGHARAYLEVNFLALTVLKPVAPVAPQSVLQEKVILQAKLLPGSQEWLVH